MVSLSEVEGRLKRPATCFSAARCWPDYVEASCCLFKWLCLPALASACCRTAVTLTEATWGIETLMGIEGAATQCEDLLNCCTRIQRCAAISTTFSTQSSLPSQDVHSMETFAYIISSSLCV